MILQGRPGRPGPTIPSARWHLVDRSGWRNSHPERILLPTPRTGRRWHPGPAEVPIDRSGLAAELSTSAVTVKVEKRSASGPDTAGASGPGLAPAWGRSLYPVRPERSTGRGCHRRGRLPTTKASLSGQAPTEPGQPCQRHAQPRPDRFIHLHTAGRPTPRQWAGRRWRRAVLVRPRRRPLAGPPGAPGGSRE